MNYENTPVMIEATAISADMRKFITQFQAGEIKREDADTLANISGKNLKALAIILADKALQDGHFAMNSRMKLLKNKG